MRIRCDHSDRSSSSPRRPNDGRRLCCRMLDAQRVSVAPVHVQDSNVCVLPRPASDTLESNLQGGWATRQRAAPASTRRVRPRRPRRRCSGVYAHLQRLQRVHPSQRILDVSERVQSMSTSILSVLLGCSPRRSMSLSRQFARQCEESVSGRSSSLAGTRLIMGSLDQNVK